MICTEGWQLRLNFIDKIDQNALNGFAFEWAAVKTIRRDIPK